MERFSFIYHIHARKWLCPGTCASGAYDENIAGDAQTLASSLTHSAFNISNALGASFGGLAIAYGGSWVSTGWVGVCFFFYRFNFNVFISTNDEKNNIIIIVVVFC
ncbi:hypothetical protein LNP74_02325 [Klebsiella pneumoniae subsp. pneumoniae]|nr:hypothetical protein [Klebsiella pneumoniae subsp. pneumoniae]